MLAAHVLSGEPPSATVVLMCGLPAAGKSTLAARMMSELSVNSCSDGRTSEELRPQHNRVVLIDYDDIANAIATSDAPGSSDIPPVPDNTSFVDADLKAWRESRKAALSKLEYTLMTMTNTTLDNDDGNLLVVLDDNFHLRSMRRDVYKVCQKILSSDDADAKKRSTCRRRIGFSVIMVDTPLEICLQRNASRKGKARIPDDTIRNMAARLERPVTDTKDYMRKFEVNSICIEVTDSSTPYDMYDENKERILACINQSLDDPVIPPKKENILDPEVLRIERERTLKNRVHRIDKLLRTLVGAVGRADKSMGRIANEARKHALENARNDAESSEEYVDDIASIVEQFKTYLVDNGSDKIQCDSFVLTAIDDAYQAMNKQKSAKK